MNSKQSKNSTKKYKIVKPVRFTAIVSALVLISIFSISSLFGYSDVSAAQKPEYVTVRIQDGDTLWYLAKKYGPDNQDIRKTIYDIRKLNEMDNSNIIAGQYITIQTN